MEGLITSSIIRRGNGGVNYTSWGSFKVKMTSREKPCKVLNSVILQNLVYTHQYYMKHQKLKNVHNYWELVSVEILQANTLPPSLSLLTSPSAPGKTGTLTPRSRKKRRTAGGKSPLP